MPTTTSSSAQQEQHQQSPQDGLPHLHHTISHDGSSVLALAVDESNSLIFSSGSQSECIYVWSLDTFRPVTRLVGHSASILALELAPEKNWLFSASGDDTVRIWDTRTFALLYIIQHTATDDDEGNVGDVFVLKWNQQLQTLYMGCQNTSIRWVRLSRLKALAGGGGGVGGGADHPQQTRNYHHSRQSSDPQWSSPPNEQEERPIHGTRETQSSLETYLAESETGVLPASAIPIAKPHKFFDSNAQRERERDGLSRTFSGSSGPSTPMLHSLSGFPSSPGHQQTVQAPSRSNVESPELSAVKGKNFDLDFGNALHEHIGAAVATAPHSPNVRYLQPSRSCTVPNAHYGYVYALTLLHLDEPHRVVLASGSGDEDVKIWSCSARDKGRLQLLATLSGSEGAVLALTSWAGTLLAGKQGGNIDVWDLETFTLIRTIEAHQDDVLALCSTHASAEDPVLLSAGADGYVNRYDRNFALRDRWNVHQDAIVLSCAALQSGSFITGGSDQVLKFWRADTSAESTSAVTPSSSTAAKPFLPNRVGFESTTTDEQGNTSTQTSFDTMLIELAKFVSYKSVSDEDHREDARQCAHYLKATLISLGAGETSVIPGAVGRNPLILSVFRARGPDGTIKRPRRRVLFYGHYDTISALDSTQWKSDPWTLSGRDGYLYGRGASDNKGPILSVATAVSRLWNARKLDVDVVFLVEGEEESGSVGFQEALKREKERIGHIDVILLSNSYWIDDVTPCLTMGMRGVIQASITIQAPTGGETSASSSPDVGQAHAHASPPSNVSSPNGTSTTTTTDSKQQDVHSGVQGGAVREPMIDMLRLLSHLSTGEKVLIPDFYRDVRRLSPEERQRYAEVVDLLHSHQQQRRGEGDTSTGSGGANHHGQSCSSMTSSSHATPTIESLMARWRFPSLSVHSVTVSGSGNSTVIPALVCAKISLRLVPDQDLSSIQSSLITFLESTFTSLYSSSSLSTRKNELSIKVNHTADWWLGSPTSAYTQTLSDSIQATWNQAPLEIREGGSIPTVALLEKEMRAQAVHLPMGQSSDNAHLKDERISLQCLYKGRDVVERWLLALGSGDV